MAARCVIRLPEEPKLTPYQALEHIAYYIVLASHDNEQSDMLHRVFRYPELEKMPLH